MGDSNSWSVDRLAANNLVASLKLEASSDIADLVAEHFARHRESSIGWAAQRAHSHIIRKLEDASMTRGHRESDEWRDGYRFAEQQIFTTMPEEMLELAPEKTWTKGQALRAMVRQARTR